MAFICIEIDSTSSESVTQANQQLINDSSKPQEGVEAIKQQLEKILSGCKDASVQVVVRSTTASLAASGGGISKTYNLK